MTQLELQQAQQDLNSLYTLKTCSTLSEHFRECLIKEIGNLEASIRNAKILIEKSKTTSYD